MRLKIKRMDPTVSLPAYGTDDAAGFDLAAAHDVAVPAGRIVLVRTGLIIEVPAGHCLAIFARSSTPLKRGLIVANGVGIIDPEPGEPTGAAGAQSCTSVFADEMAAIADERKDVVGITGAMLNVRIYQALAGVHAE